MNYQYHVLNGQKKNLLKSFERAFSRLLQLDHHPGRDAHRHEFLKQQFTRVRNADFGNLSFVATPFALEGIVAQIGDGHETAKIANVDGVRVGNLKETLTQKLKSKKRIRRSISFCRISVIMTTYLHPQ